MGSYRLWKHVDSVEGGARATTISSLNDTVEREKFAELVEHEKRVAYGVK